jgi:hypothetical protein
MDRKVLIRVSLALAVPIAVFAGANLLDEPMRKEVFQLLEAPAAVPDGAKQSFEYFLGMGAPADQDPLSVGRDLYRRAYANPTDDLLKEQRWLDELDAMITPTYERAARYLKADELVPMKARLEELVRKGDLWIKRYDHLTSLGEIAPDIRGSAPLRSSTLPLIALWRLKAAQLNLALHDGQDAAVLQDLMRIFAFHRASVIIAPTMLKVSAGLYVMKVIRVFAEKAAADRPSFAKLVSPKSFYVDLDTEKLKQEALENELRGMEVMLIDEKVARANHVRPLIFNLANQQRNRILNHDYECARSAKMEQPLLLRFYPVAYSAG